MLLKQELIVDPKQPMFTSGGLPGGPLPSTQQANWQEKPRESNSNVGSFIPRIMCTLQVTSWSICPARRHGVGKPGSIVLRTSCSATVCYYDACLGHMPAPISQLQLRVHLFLALHMGAHEIVHGATGHDFLPYAALARCPSAV